MQSAAEPKFIYPSTPSSLATTKNLQNQEFFWPLWLQFKEITVNLEEILYPWYDIMWS